MNYTETIIYDNINIIQHIVIFLLGDFMSIPSVKWYINLWIKFVL